MAHTVGRWSLNVILQEKNRDLALVYNVFVGNWIGVGLMFVFYPPLREKVDNVRRVVYSIHVERAKSVDCS